VSPCGPVASSSPDSPGSGGPIHEAQAHLGVLAQHFEVALISSCQWNLPGYRNARNQNVPQLLALRTGAGCPYAVGIQQNRLDLAHQPALTVTCLQPALDQPSIGR